ncbi:hypothetical protein QFZ71_005300 [Streptomyces sp. V2I9]|nr:hypothetical protein [Streptomyces sp. V2I9]
MAGNARDTRPDIPWRGTPQWPAGEWRKAPPPEARATSGARGCFGRSGPRAEPAGVGSAHGQGDCQSGCRTRRRSHGARGGGKPPGRCRARGARLQSRAATAPKRSSPSTRRRRATWRSSRRPSRADRRSAGGWAAGWNRPRRRRRRRRCPTGTHPRLTDRQSGRMTDHSSGSPTGTRQVTVPAVPPPPDALSVGPLPRRTGAREAAPTRPVHRSPAPPPRRRTPGPPAPRAPGRRATPADTRPGRRGPPAARTATPPPGA